MESIFSLKLLRNNCRLLVSQRYYNWQFKQFSIRKPYTIKFYQFFNSYDLQEFDKTGSTEGHKIWFLRNIRKGGLLSQYKFLSPDILNVKNLHNLREKRIYSKKGANFVIISKESILKSSLTVLLFTCCRSREEGSRLCIMVQCPLMTLPYF